MDDLVRLYTAFPPLEPTTDVDYDDQARSLVTLLHQTSQANLSTGNGELLSILNPSIHTIPYLYVLHATIERTAASGKASRAYPQAALPNGQLWPHLVQILTQFDPIQVRYAGHIFRELVELVVRGVEQSSNYIPVIQLLHHVILRLDPTSSALTSIHLRYVELCLLSRTFAEAADILDRPIYHLPTSLDKTTTARSYEYLCTSDIPSSAYLSPVTGLTTKLSCRSYLEYQLHASMIYIGLKRWADALFFLEAVISAPSAGTASMVMVEAYKKWMLVGVLDRGRPPRLPKGTHGSAIKTIRAIAKPYDCLVDAFKSGNELRFQAEVRAGESIWSRDCNSGLVFEVYHSFRRFAVRRLAKTFDALPVGEVAQRTSPNPTDLQETAAYLTSLISSGDLHATLTQAKSSNDLILRFTPPSLTAKSEVQIQNELSELQYELQTVLKHVSDTDHRVEINKDYIEMLRKLKRQKDAAAAKSAEGGRLVGGSARHFDDDDEDMMEGLG